MTVQSGHALIFAHDSHPRVAASVTLAGVVVVLIGGALTVGPHPRIDTRAHGAQSEAKAVRVIGAQPRADLPCDQQLWPKISENCLVRTGDSAKPPAHRHAAGTSVVSEVAQDAKKLTPMTATGAVTVGHTTTENAGVASDRPKTSTTTAPSVPTETVGAARVADGIAARDNEDMPRPERAHPKRHYARRLPFRLNFGGFRF